MNTVELAMAVNALDLHRDYKEILEGVKEMKAQIKTRDTLLDDVMDAVANYELQRIDRISFYTRMSILRDQIKSLREGKGGKHG